MSHFHSLRKLFNINTIFSTGKEEHGKSPHFIYTLPNFKSSSVHGQSFYILVRVRTCCFYFLCLHSWKKRTHISSALNKQLYFWHFWAAIVWHQQMPYNFTQFWHYLPGESIWSHRSKGSVLQDWPSLQMLINGPGYYLCFWWPGVNQRFPGPSHGLDWSGTVAHRTRANCLLTRLPDY